jgi:DNA-directed RNA polymerase specialized sigma24 family protein
VPRSARPLPRLTDAQRRVVADNYALCRWAVSRPPAGVSLVAAELRRRGLTGDDLLSLAGEALCRAAATWDPALAPLSVWFATAYRYRLQSALHYLKRSKRDAARLTPDRFAADAIVAPDATCGDPPPGGADIARLVAALPGRFRTAATLRYGFDGHRPHLFREIARTLGCTKQRARRLVSQAEEQVLRSLVAEQVRSAAPKAA